VGEVEHLRDAVDHGIADGNQSIGTSQRNSGQQMLCQGSSTHVIAS